MNQSEPVSNDGEELWTPQQTADFLQVSMQTLANWRSSPHVSRARRLNYCYVGNKPRYRKSEVMAFINSNKVSCTSQRFAKQRQTNIESSKLGGEKVEIRVQAGDDQPKDKPLRPGQVAYFDLLKQLSKYTKEEKRPAVRFFLRRTLGL